MHPGDRRALLPAITRVLCKTLLGLLIAGTTLWGVLAIFYSNLPGSWLRLAAALAFLAATVAWFIFLPLRRACLVFLATWIAVVAWFLLIPPSNTRDWQPDVAVLPYADIGTQQVTIHNIRNCDYRSETDYTVRHYDKTFDLTKLESVDLYVVHWGSPLIAHTMMSFGFSDGAQVCFSIEARKEKGEAYSAIKGFFRQFELIYVVGDERDLVRLRTNYRGEEVHLYRLKSNRPSIELVFLSYLREINRLKDRAQWYNAATSNCTTNIRGHTKPYSNARDFDWRILINGSIDELVYERKVLDQSLPFPELRTRCHINDRARAADKDPEFSARIREGLPGF
jgi:hypothetical protein